MALLNTSTSVSDPLAPRLRLFLSVDIVGSTNFKHVNQELNSGESPATDQYRGQRWAAPIVQFYREIERLFTKEWELYCQDVAGKHNLPAGENPQLWKSAGDELLYTKVLTDSREIVGCLNCWISALKDYRRVLRGKHPELDIKSCGWLAGFPITNTEVIFRSYVKGLSFKDDDDDPLFSNLNLLSEFYGGSNSENLYRDFVGPSIDTGFRLCTLANPRKFIISLDLALMIARTLEGIAPDLGASRLQIYYDGRVALKGVLGGTPYPVFWIDMATSPDTDGLEDKISKRGSIDRADVKKFCENFIKDSSGKMIVPYIVKNDDPYFSNMPINHDKKVESLRYYFESEKKKRIDEEKAFTEDTSGDLADQKEVDKLLSDIERITGIS